MEKIYDYLFKTCSTVILIFFIVLNSKLLRMENKSIIGYEIRHQECKLTHHTNEIIHILIESCIKLHIINQFQYIYFNYNMFELKISNNN